MNLKKALLLSAVVVLIALFFVFDLHQLLSLEYFKQHQSDFMRSFEQNPLLTGGGFFLIYVLVTALSLPGAAVMTLAAGALFGFGWGLVLVSFASSIGATLAFLCSRFLFRSVLEQRFGKQLESINAGIERDGAFYLFTLRLVPLFPFFVINLVMGLTHLRTLTFYWVSQLGMLLGTMVYVNAGTQLGQIDSLSGILSPALIISFCLLGIFPLIAKQIIAVIQRRKVYQGIEKPTKFDTNMVVIGAGSAGLVSAYIAAAAKAKVSLIEKHKMGGDCLNTGCVPSKALIRSARFIQETREVESLGLKSASVEYEFSDVMERVQRVIKTVEPHDSVERYTGLGVDCIQGAAKILSPYRVEVNGEQITTRNIVIATGARPAIPPIKNIEAMEPLTSDTVWNLREQPKRLLILGGGPIGCELTQAFARLGSQVIQVLRGPRVLPKEDPEIAARVQHRLVAEGVDLRLNHKMIEFVERDGQKMLLCEHEGESVEVAFDQLLVATGRKANVEGFGAETLDLALTADGRIEVNEFLQTRFPNVFACGDVCSPYQFTHSAAHQAWYAVVNALLGGIKRFKVDYSIIPAATFTEPEIARVGYNELEAKAAGIDYEVTEFDLEELDRAIADETASGMVKVLTVPGKDKILGVTIAGPHSGELLSEFTLAMRHGLGLNKILGTIHIYPTLSEANKYAAGQWKRNHVPEKLMGYLARFHRWRRGH
ncbi:pyridine nucleotide-disulfide oxidoreductase [Motiliproteus coralliicola]|uniref:Pyridine nucleotide-disulfide oxidoreductase n=1 Tax=Motiliproteus coralliicola TaxID=2283196 RepID=A0A369WVI7_9GAMM|nr:bifunctional TVP38/TMEM64 family protein/FAD-dependent oxidoreductase [Motiliproteus coralliicola]RDE24556.1 pyridine nucleotide-disulfide oxidoreductase [Motiliproteus coralliicola]